MNAYVCINEILDNNKKYATFENKKISRSKKNPKLTISSES